MKVLPLIFLLPALVVAVMPNITVDIDVGEVLVQGSRAENVKIRLQSGEGQDWRQWTLTMDAPAWQYQKQKILQPALQATFSQQGDDWQLNYARWRGRFAGSEWSVSSEALQLSQLLQAQGDWPAGMQLQLKEESGAVQAEFGAQHGKARLRLPGKQLSAWLKAAGIAIPEIQGTALSDLTVTRLGGKWHLQGDMRVENGAWSSADAMVALEKGQGNLTFSASGTGQSWQGDFALALDGGEALISPLYFHLRDNPLGISGQWQLQKNQLHLNEVQFSENEAHGELRARLQWPSLALQDLDITQASGDADAIYRRYAQPFLAETLFADLTLKGTLFATLHWQKGEWREWSAVFNQVDVVDKQGRFALYGLDGQFGRGGVSRLRSRESQWRKLPVGGWQAAFRWEADGVHLQEAVRIPILGGAVVIARLEPVDKRDYRLDARIEPIDLLALSKALDLPEFDGQVSGEFRQIHFNREGLRLQEPVYINIFGGRVAVNDLRIEQFFSAQPLLHFDLDIDKLDLKRLTHVMQVAEIQGNISGKARDVQLANWKVKRFIADVYTSPDNPGKRSISHEAVQYLSQAGGGSALVGEFVRVLNAFPYAKLGFSASLANNVLNITGVEEASDGGYYLVKGRGLPHLNIIGYERRVDWPELLRRLDAARHTDSAIVD